MTTAIPAQAGLDAYVAATRADETGLVRALRDLLGARLVAYLAGVQETRAVREWAEGERAIRKDEVVQRLRIAYQVSLLISARDSAAVAQSWFQGLNPQLDDRSPAAVLREMDPAAGGPLVLSAARAFAALG
jgi:hypothetical protein